MMTPSLPFYIAIHEAVSDWITNTDVDWDTEKTKPAPVAQLAVARAEQQRHQLKENSQEYQWVRYDL